MTKFRRTALVAGVLTAGVLVVGCAKTVNGTASFVGGTSSSSAPSSGPSGGGIDQPSGSGSASAPPSAGSSAPSGSTGPSSAPESSDAPTGPATSAAPTSAGPSTGPATSAAPSTGAPTSASPSAPPSQTSGTISAVSPCHVFTFAELKTIFGAPVIATDIDTFGCDLRAGDTYIPVSVYHNLSVDDQTKSDTGAKKSTILGHPGATLGSGYLVISRGQDPAAGGIVEIFCQTDEHPIALKLAAKLLKA